MKSTIRWIQRFFKSLKFSGVSKLLAASVAIIGGIQKISSSNVIKPTLQTIYQNDIDSTVIILTSISLIGLGLLAEKGVLKNQFEGRTMRDILPLIEDHTSFKKDVPKDIDEIWLCGISFLGTITANRDQIVHLLSKRGVKIKIILAPKSGPAFDQILSFFPTVLTQDDLAARIKVSHNELSKWSQKYKNLEVKTFRVFPSHKLSMFDPDDNHTLQIQPFVYDTDPKLTPLVKLINNEHKEYFKIYKKAFQDLWLASDIL